MQTLNLSLSLKKYDLIIHPLYPYFINLKENITVVIKKEQENNFKKAKNLNFKYV